MQRLILFFCFLLFLSCNNEDEDQTTFPVLYHLSKGHKEILENYALNQSVYFSDNDGDTILFKADEVKHLLTYYIQEDRRGEGLNLYYTCQSNYMKTFKFGYQLVAIDDSTSEITLITISGDLGGGKMVQDFNASSSAFTIPTSSNSVYNSVATTPFKYDESFLLGADTLESIYSFNKLGSFGWGPLSTYIIYSKEYGIVEFDTKDGKVWRRNIEK